MKKQVQIKLESRVQFRATEFSPAQYPATGTVAAISPEIAACFVNWDDNFPSQWVPMDKLHVLLAN